MLLFLCLKVMASFLEEMFALNCRHDGVNMKTTPCWKERVPSESVPEKQSKYNKRSLFGCGSFFCKDSFLGSATQRPPPRMIGRWTAGTTRRCCRSGRRRAGQLRGGFSHRTWSRRCAPEPQRQQALQGLFSARLGALASLLLATLLPLPPGSLPRLVPTSIADGIAQR